MRASVHSLDLCVHGFSNEAKAAHVVCNDALRQLQPSHMQCQSDTGTTDGLAELPQYGKVAATQSELQCQS